MCDNNIKFLREIGKRPGNDACADCGSKNPEYASYNIGIFVCARCSDIHRSMGCHISKVKHLTVDRWEDSQVQRMKDVGNMAAKLKYEERVPPCYRIPDENENQVLLEQWIFSKYQREEFIHPERQSYISGYMEGFLMKRGKEDSKYLPRKFVLREADDTLKYYIKETKEPKAILRISELNVAFAPKKIGHANSLQITFLKDGSTRHIYVYHDDPETIVNWYMAIRSAKFNRLHVAYPSANESELVKRLTQDFAREGWLWKTGPRSSDGYKKRWFTLDNRKLMYHDEPLDAYPKGEIFLGNMMDGYGVRVGVSPKSKDQGYSFTLRTPDRSFHLSAETEEERDEWIHVLDQVLEKPLTPQDNSIAARLVRKRNANSSINIFSAR